MSILSRITRIIRANLPSGSVGDPHIGDSFYEEYLRRKRRKTNFEEAFSQESHSYSGESQNRPADPNWDPVLAEYYANLEVPYGSDLKTVRRAWKKLLRKYHPDLYSGVPEKEELANKLVQKLNNAYKELEKRLSA
jgi:DnaJ-domain-containing protein 1